MVSFFKMSYPSSLKNETPRDSDSKNISSSRSEFSLSNDDTLSSNQKMIPCLESRNSRVQSGGGAVHHRPILSLFRHKSKEKSNSSKSPTGNPSKTTPNQKQKESHPNSLKRGGFTNLRSRIFHKYYGSTAPSYGSNISNTATSPIVITSRTSVNHHHDDVTDDETVVADNSNFLPKKYGGYLLCPPSNATSKTVYRSSSNGKVATKKGVKGFLRSPGKSKSSSGSPQHQEIWQRIQPITDEATKSSSNSTDPVVDCKSSTLIKGSYELFSLQESDEPPDNDQSHFSDRQGNQPCNDHVLQESSDDYDSDSDDDDDTIKTVSSLKSEISLSGSKVPQLCDSFSLSSASSRSTWATSESSTSSLSIMSAATVHEEMLGIKAVSLMKGSLIPVKPSWSENIGVDTRSTLVTHDGTQRNFSSPRGSLVSFDSKNYEDETDDTSLEHYQCPNERMIGVVDAVNMETDDIGSVVDRVQLETTDCDNTAMNSSNQSIVMFSDCVMEGERIVPYESSAGSAACPDVKADDRDAMVSDGDSNVISVVSNLEPENICYDQDLSRGLCAKEDCSRFSYLEFGDYLKTWCDSDGKQRIPPSIQSVNNVDHTLVHSDEAGIFNVSYDVSCITTESDDPLFPSDLLNESIDVDHQDNGISTARNDILDSEAVDFKDEECSSLREELSEIPADSVKQYGLAGYFHSRQSKPDSNSSIINSSFHSIDIYEDLEDAASDMTPSCVFIEDQKQELDATKDEIQEEQAENKDEGTKGRQSASMFKLLRGLDHKEYQDLVFLSTLFDESERASLARLSSSLYHETEMTLLTTYSIALMLGDHESQLGYEQDLDLLRQQAAMVTIHQQSEKVRKRMSCEIVEDSTGINLHLRTKYGVESMLLNAVARQCKEVIAAERQSRTSTDKGMAQYLNNIALMRTIRNCLGMSMFKSLMNSSSEISENSSNGTCSRDLEQFDQDFSELDNWSCLN